MSDAELRELSLEELRQWFQEAPYGVTVPMDLYEAVTGTKYAGQKPSVQTAVGDAPVGGIWNGDIWTVAQEGDDVRACKWEPLYPDQKRP